MKQQRCKMIMTNQDFNFIEIYFIQVSVLEERKVRSQLE